MDINLLLLLKYLFSKKIGGEKQMAELLVVKAKLKDVVKDMNVSGDFAEALSEEVRKLILKAAERSKANGRRTVGARDL